MLPKSCNKRPYSPGKDSNLRMSLVRILRLGKLARRFEDGCNHREISCTPHHTTPPSATQGRRSSEVATPP